MALSSSRLLVPRNGRSLNVRIVQHFSNARTSDSRSAYPRARTGARLPPQHLTQRQQQQSPAAQLTLTEQRRRERMAQISASMQLYLKSLRENAELQAAERQQFEQGKRHLANMMGFDADTMTQKQVEDSIKYLFPSGLFDKKALPQMVKPDTLDPPRVLDVDQSGWPKHSLFYTLRPKFYSILSDINKRTMELVQNYDHQLRLANRQRYDDEEQVTPAGYHRLSTAGYKWIGKEKLENNQVQGEIITDEMYANLVVALEYMAQLPNASLEQKFIDGFRTSLLGGSAGDMTGEKASRVQVFTSRKVKVEIPKVEIDRRTGCRFATGFSTLKATKASSLVKEKGTGILTVNGHHYDVFRSIQAREILLSPMIVTGMLGQIDVNAKILDGPGGLSVTPRIVRHATALAIAALFPHLGERLRLAGLLNADLRRREREKINQPGARAKWIWKKR